jgi:hypothetical protein
MLSVGCCWCSGGVVGGVFIAFGLDFRGDTACEAEAVCVFSVVICLVVGVVACKFRMLFAWGRYFNGRLAERSKAPV